MSASSSPGSPFSLIATSVGVELAGSRVLHHIDLAVHQHTRLGIIGANGSGKSTLLAVLAGERRPTVGSMSVTPGFAAVGHVHQVRPRSDVLVLDLLRQRAGITAAQLRFDRAVTALAADDHGAADEYELALEHWLALDVSRFDATVLAMLEQLGLHADIAHRSSATLSGGQAALVELASIMVSRYPCMLLDEPTNDLDAAGLSMLDCWVSNHPGALVVVSHDRAFLERTVDSIFELDPHTRSGRLFHGGWDAYQEERASHRRDEERRYAEHLGEKRRLADRAEQQRQWVDRGLRRSARQPDEDKHRRRAAVAQTEKLAARAAATTQQLHGLAPVKRPWVGWELRFTIAEAERSGSLVAEIEGAVFQRGEFVLGPLDLYIEWGSRLALCGANGTGKSTLIDGLLGRLQPTTGSVRLGPAVVVGELDQWRDGPSRDRTEVLDAFESATGLVGAQARAVLAKFGVDSDMVQRHSSALSPGERSRVQLAEFQARGVNLLVLDEPTNHLDIEAIEQLEHALESFTGTLLVVSHDQQFMKAVDVSRRIDITELVKGDRDG